jgi:membrane protein implicated in regulation of membrane protease activity
MALLMAAMLAVVSALVWWTVRRIRQEAKEGENSEQ